MVLGMITCRMLEFIRFKLPDLIATHSQSDFVQSGQISHPYLHTELLHYE